MAFSRGVKTACVLTIMCLSGASLTGPFLTGEAAAQNYEPVTPERLNRIENAIRDLQGLVYSAEGNQYTPRSTTLPGAESPSASLTVRVSQIERELQTLTGQVEELTYKIEQNSRRMETMAEAISMMNRPAPAEEGLDGDLDGGQYDSGSDGSGILYEPGMNSTLPQRAGSSSGQASSGPADLSGSGLPSGVDSPFPVVPGDEVPANPDEAYDDAFDALLSADYEAAERGFAGFIQEFPEDPRAADAQYRLGEIYLATDANSRAAVAFLDHIKQWPDDARAPESYMKLGIAYSRLGKSQEACQIFSVTQSKFPDLSADMSDRLAIERGKAGC